MKNGRIIFATHAQLAERIGEAGLAYGSALEPAIVRRDEVGVYVDSEHAGWGAAKRVREAIPRSGCVGCGDKTNVAPVKASPAAMEEMLRAG